VAWSARLLPGDGAAAADRPPAVSACARHYLLLAGVEVPRLGSHTLRTARSSDSWTPASTWKTFGDFVGDASAASTEIHTKVAVESLRQVALGDGEEVLGWARTSVLPSSVFLEHKRALGRNYHSEEHEFRLLVRFAEEHRARRLDQLTPGTAR
jgi:hypothetical protein